MSVVSMLPYAVSAAGVLALSARMCRWSRMPVQSAPLSADQIVGQAPVALRGAVMCVALPAFSLRMFLDLSLGSVDKGFPSIEWWDYSLHGISVDVLMRGGQSLADWSNETVTARMAAYVGVERVSVSSPAPGWVRLEMRVHDTLAAPAVWPGVVSNDVDLEAVPVGVREDGYAWILRILYAHILLAGATGSGKGSVLWSILAGLGPAIKAGLVDVRMADPKGGAEFGCGEDKLFTEFATHADTILAMLEQAVSEMDERLVRMRRAGLRKLVPSADEPLILIIIDEAASLSSYADRDDREKFRQLTGQLLSKGRAAAVTVIAALQDPAKDTMPNRQLFPVRVGLRLDEPNQTTMVHGQGARDRGALCDKISADTQGVGYVGEDGSTEFVRVRAFWVSDDDANTIVDAYSPAPEIAGPTEDYSDFDPDDLGDEIPGDGQGLAA
ncbi:FtsK/SpoIIIE domain-containing protein [Nocardia jiangxiensis]|uniref:FtsK/SpoIIIE domain-containing protein n=1 Tax=Nocardia jiangxiensis TaxID=282685 RepID=UPI0002DA78DF|nr:FtsK/SpoIIIE domain-containing protein [Nocardia jiangxiensis]